MTELTSELIEDFYIEKRATGNRRTKGALASRSILYIHRNLSAALKYAVKKKYLNWNPADDAEMVDIENNFARICSANEFNVLSNNTVGTDLKLPVLLALSLGMRRGEILGLTWDNIDLTNQKLLISGQLARTPNGVQVTSTKSATSRRPLPLVPSIVSALEAHKRLQDQQKQCAGKDYQDQGLVCCHSDGKPILPDYFSQAYRRFTDRHGFPDLRFHDLRHTFASLALSKGVPMAVVSSLLGHSSISITVDIYGHITDNAKLTAMQIVFDAVSDLAGIYKQNPPVEVNPNESR